MPRRIARRHPSRGASRVVRFLIATVVALTAVGPGAVVTGAGADDGSPDDPLASGELVVDGDRFWVGGDPTSTQRAASGYALGNSGLGLHASYTVRMVTNHPSWTSVDEEVADVIEQVQWATGSSMAMGPTIGSHVGNPREITVSVGTSSPCGALSFPGTIGCGGGWADGANNVLGGQVFLCSCMVSDPTLYGLVLHEIGHAVGLLHYDASWQGQLQVMYPINQFGLTYYRSGDVSGLRKLAMNGYGNGNAPTHRPGSTAQPDVGNGGFAKLEVDWPGAANFGLAIDRHQIEVRNTVTDARKIVTVGAGRSAVVPVTGGDPYQARVRAHNAKGWATWSPWSSSTYVTGRCIGSISDVSETSTFCGDIAWLLSEDIANGFSDGTFRPTRDVARQAMAAFLMRHAERLDPGSTDGDWSANNSFSDVPPDHPFHDEIEWMVASGIANGFSDGTFRGDAPLNRQAMAAMLMRFTEHLFPGSTDGNWSAVLFDDVPSGHPFHDEITWLAQTGIAEGFPDGTFKPGADISRQAVAAFLHRHDQEFG
jgi:hypothetical protein